MASSLDTDRSRLITKSVGKLEKLLMIRTIQHMNLKVSIAMCTFNGARFLLQQLESFVHQSVQPTELVVCDDGSQDDTVAILQAFAKQAPFPVRIVVNPHNLGYVKNFEQAISLCTQGIVFLADQDDVWVPHKIKSVLQVFQEEPNVGLVMHAFERIDHQGHLFAYPEERYGPEALTQEQLQDDVKSHSIRAFMLPYPRSWFGCMMAFRQEWVQLLLPIYPGKGHDDWIMKLLALVTQVRFMGSPLIQYRIHSSNTNSHLVGHSQLFIRWFRLKKRFKNLYFGYSKRNFYRRILQRVAQSRHQIESKDMAQLYTSWVKRIF
jgi:glycosyltransferase involved in cell wall biosynthesis